MFKVMCIEYLQPVRNPPPGYRTPKITDVVTVERIVNFRGFEMYLLIEYPPIEGLTFIYDAHAFAPLSGPDEVELLEQRTEAEIARLEAEYHAIGGEPIQVDPVAMKRIWQNISKELDLKS